MSCPRNRLGFRDCEIIQHPDRRGEESFCSVCEKRFYDRDGTSPAGGALLRAILLALLTFVLIQFVRSAFPPETVPQQPSSLEMQQN